MNIDLAFGLLAIIVITVLAFIFGHMLSLIR